MRKTCRGTILLYGLSKTPCFCLIILLLLLVCFRFVCTVVVSSCCLNCTNAFPLLTKTSPTSESYKTANSTSQLGLSDDRRGEGKGNKEESKRKGAAGISLSSADVIEVPASSGTGNLVPTLHYVLGELSPPQRLFFDYCYFYWDTQRGPLRRRRRELGESEQVEQGNGF